MGFFKLHSVANYQKIEGGPFGDIEKVSKSHTTEKRGKSHSVEKSGKGDPSALEFFLFHVRGFGCVHNEVLSTYGKSA